MLIDAGAGTLLGPHTGKLSNNLLGPRAIDPNKWTRVFLTHMYIIGGLMSGRPASFPERYLRADKRDTDYWLSEENDA